MLSLVVRWCLIHHVLIFAFGFLWLNGFRVQGLIVRPDASFECKARCTAKATHTPTLVANS